MNKLFKEISSMYVAEKVGTNENCQRCINESASKNLCHIGPVPIYHVGNNYELSPERVVLVGSVAYGWDEIVQGRMLSLMNSSLGVMTDVSERFNEIILKENYRYISLVRKILIGLYGTVENALSYVAITNVVHCNSGNVRGGAPTHLKYYCAHSSNNFMLTKKELDILNPTHVISMAGNTGGNDYVREHWGLNMEKVLIMKHPCAGGVKHKDYVNKVVSFVRG